MLVLNTTSPRASPSAPAESPRKIVPSSSASIASTLSYPSALRTSHCALRTAHFALRTSHCALSVHFPLCSSRCVSLWLFERRGDLCALAGGHADRCRPAAVAIELDLNGV